jgi:WD40 repeat protein
LSPDSRRVLTASWDNTARLWEAETGMLMATGKLLATFQGHTGAVNRRISADSLLYLHDMGKQDVGFVAVWLNDRF